MSANQFAGLHIPLDEAAKLKRRYSVTVDVVGFRRCARQYGAFQVHKYAPAHQTQLYFGTILHQVLDRCHAHYHGLVDPKTKNKIPDNGLVLPDSQLEAFFEERREAQQKSGVEPPPPSEIVSYFIEVEDGLKSQNIRAVTPDLRLTTLRILQYFNALEGPALYPRVVDTEHRLQADRGDHILQGVVDLLANTTEEGKDPAQCEMWDYKGTSRTSLTKKDLETYEFQMRVYARLYELKHGVPPKRAILYFLNELDGPAAPTTRPVNALMEITLPAHEVEAASSAFAGTVAEIEVARAADRWDPPVPGNISDQDCAICDLRWDCPTPNNGKGVQMRYP